MVTTQFWRGLAYVAIASLSFVATSWLLHALLPPAIPEDVEAKLKFFAEHKDEFDTLILGSSRIYYAISPEIFDKTTGENGVPTRTFNFGVNAMFPPENFYVLEQILKTKPRNLKWVVIEMEEIQNKWTEQELGTQRVLYWHDWPRTALTLKKTLDPRGDATWYRKVARLWLARRHLATNITLFARQFVNVGRGAALLSSWGKQALRRQIPNSVRNRTATGRPAARCRRSAPRILGEGWRRKFPKRGPSLSIPPRTRPIVNPRRGFAKSAPTRSLSSRRSSLQSAVSFRQSPPAPLLVFNDSRKYPALFDTAVRIDDAHLTREGSEEFTRLLAQEFVRQTRQP